MKEPLNKNEARKLIGKILRKGGVYFSRHARERMADRSLTSIDVANVLRCGLVVLVEEEKGSWRYKVATPRFSIVVAFRGEEELAVVTVMRERS